MNTALILLSLLQDPGIELFEKRIRPVLAEHCYSCHNSRDKRKGGLALDDRASIRLGGDSGPAVVPGDPAKSLLLPAIRHEGGKRRMPKGGPKLEASIIRDFEAWIRKGASDPRDAPPTPEELAAETSWEVTLKRRLGWWSLQPIQASPPPDAGGSSHPVDRFIHARLSRAGLQVSGKADRRTFIRRVTFALTGLPPTPAETGAFLADTKPGAEDRLVDRLLASDAFGERWARHWMDWFRYAESLGSEGDPRVPHAWRYRDYLIRALNQDVPYDRLVREHLAGDLLKDPRLNRELGINESPIGLAHLRMPFIGFFPTDALDEQVRFTENQIDVLSKALLGMTVSCARCHDHKFDAISQKDFYALYGILASSRPALVTVSTPDRLDTNRAHLTALKAQIRTVLAGAWLKGLEDRFTSMPRSVMDQARRSPVHPLHVWVRMGGKKNDAVWAEFTREMAASRKRLRERKSANPLSWDLGSKDHASWFRHGNGLPDRPAPAGDFHVLPEGDRVLSNIHPSGVYTHSLSSKHNGFLTSPRFLGKRGEIWFRAFGTNDARARFVVQNYPRGAGTVYPVTRLKKGTALQWRQWGKKQVSYWDGDHLYVELATVADIPTEAGEEGGRSVFGVSEVVVVEEGKPAPRDEAVEFLAPLFEDPNPPADLSARYVSTLRRSIEAWRDGKMSDAQARFLGGTVRSGLLPTSLGELPKVKPMVDRYRMLELEIPSPVRVPGVVEAAAFDQPFYPRGDHKKPGDPVERRFLEGLGGTAYATKASGRRELAEDILSPRNPLTARVIVNRLWHHLFGTGIVATPDNLGRLGEKPTHPELLDYLADRFVRDGWSIKRMIRLIVTSETYRRDSRAPADAATMDPANKLLARFPVRRLEAEAIRDAILAVSGRLDRREGGPGENGRSNRRSVYVQVFRNRMDPFLTTFDAPEPLSARGRRNVTNVPAQSLTMMNDPWVIGVAQSWASRVLGDRTRSDVKSRLEVMYEAALGRAPSDREVARATAFLEGADVAAAGLRKERDAAVAELDGVHRRLSTIVDPARARLLQARRQGRAPGPKVPEPKAVWDFSKGTEELKSGLKGRLHGRARLEGGGLVVDGNGSCMETDPLPWALKAKTLEVWVQLSRLDQRGGGVMTVQTKRGNVFDSIVFGEKDPGQWLAGSDFFRRTQSFGGSPESEAVNRPVHLAIAYGEDGTVTGYRNGKPYGRSYRSQGLQPFAAGGSTVVFGCRHLPVAGGRLLHGRVLKARLYDRALTPEEIAVSAGASPDFVSEKELLIALTEEQKAEKERLERAAAVLEKKLQAMGGDTPRASGASWRDLAQSIFNLKEFIYVR